ncbi:MAG: helix-turn-helix domain-containing protein, partial [Dehalococcoidia bacterium]
MQTQIVDLGGLLRSLRVRRGLTQEDLADRIPDGLSVDTVSNIERGRVRPRRHTLLALLDILEPGDSERGAALNAWQKQSPHAADGEPPLSSLPIHTSPLIGRDRELAALERLLRDRAVRLITLTGPGGVGKTRLAVAAAATLRSRFADGTVFVDLASEHDPDRFLIAVARSLGLADMGDRPVEEQLTTSLRPKHLLLLLDNCETVVTAGPQLARLIERCPALTVLATSREAVRIHCEQEYPVHPLELPSPEETADILSLALVPAVSLFCERARMVAPDFAVVTDNATTVTQICRRLDGLPLTIELAAARIRHYGVDALLARLANALNILVGGPRDLPERQRTLRATLDWSYALLTVTERAALRRLSVFVDGFTEPAAAFVCAIHDDQPEHVEFADLLASLLDKNLIRIMPDQSRLSAPEPRYGMLETIREYARERVEESNDDAAVRDRHAQFYCQLAESSFAPMYSSGRGRWIETLTAETGNLDAALSWTMRMNSESSLGVRLAGALSRYWYFAGRLNHGRAWLATALDSPAGRRPTSWRARALYSAGKLAWAQGDYDVAVQYAEAALALAAETEDEQSRGEYLILAGYTRMAVGRPVLALSALHEGRRIFEEAGDAWQVAFATVMASEAHSYSGDHGAASLDLDDALTGFKQAGDQWGEAVVHGMMAGAAWRRGDASDIERHIVRADAIFQTMGEKYGQSR